MNFGRKHLADLRRILFISFLLILFIFSLPGQALAKVYFLRRPYPVYQNDPTTMTILTHTSTFVTSAKIYWSTDRGQSGSASMKLQKSNEHPNRRDYRVVSYTWPHGTFKPNTRVYYTVKVFSWKFSAKYSGDFYTAYPQDHKTLSFFALGDTRDCTQAYRRVMKKLWDVSSHARERLILHTGDFVFSGGNAPILPQNSNFNKYFFRQHKDNNGANYSYRRMPLMATVGNHEYPSDQYPNDGNLKYYIQSWPYQMYKRSCGLDPLGHLDDSHVDSSYLPKTCYSFDHGPIHFISLASSNDDCHQTQPAKDSSKRFTQKHRQYTWLERDLKKNTKPWIVVFMHAPIWNGVHRHRDNHKWLIPLFERYGVTAVFEGHDHYFWYGKMSGVDGKADNPKIAYMLLGGGGCNDVLKWQDKKKYGTDLKHQFQFARVEVWRAPFMPFGENAYYMVAEVYFSKATKKWLKHKKKKWKWYSKYYVLSGVKHY